uniref:Uncharacterized protein n=1 Tax=Anopheles culicifacies TaxID=139723 RepID=A0A182MHK5_9DIPT
MTGICIVYRGQSEQPESIEVLRCQSEQPESIGVLRSRSQQPESIGLLRSQSEQPESIGATGVDRSTRSESIGVLRSRSEYSGVNRSTQAWMEIRSQIRSSIGVEVGFQSVESEWIREDTPELPSLLQIMKLYYR